MPETARAAVQTGDRHLEMQELPIPDPIGTSQVLLAVEGCGLCGTDWEQYVGDMAEKGAVEYPCIPGHEPVGTVVEMGSAAESNRRVSVGDRVAVEPFAPCDRCLDCVEGDYNLCADKRTYGFQPTTEQPGLWGGYGEYMTLRASTRLHHLPSELSVENATLYNPLGAGFDWICRGGDVRSGDSVLIMGPGQRGLSCVIAANESGADQIIVTGLAADTEKLSLAETCGATETIVADERDTGDRGHELTDGRGVDLAVDLTPQATDPVVTAVESVRRGGRVVLAGLKGGHTVSEFDSDRVVRRHVSIQGVHGVRSWGYERAIETIAAGRYPFEDMHTGTFGIEDAERAIAQIGPERDENPIHITITP
jgi:threonine dehydrogenase-like Zn-dependent dehydrogenase